MTDYDLIVVGGGMTGASLALALAATRWTVAIVDPRPDNPSPGSTDPSTGGDFSPRVSALAPSSQTWLHEVGAWPLIPATRLSPYTHMHVWDADGSGVVHFDAADLGNNEEVGPLGYIVENSWVEHALWERLNQTDRVKTCNGERVEHAERRNDGAWSLELLGSDGRVRFLTCRQLVIADGARSPLRESLDFSTRRWSCNQTALVATVRHEHGHQSTARQAFHREGPLAFLPLRLPHYSSIVWSMDTGEANEFLALDPAIQAQRLTGAIGFHLGAVELCSELHSFPLYQMFAQRYWQPGAVLAGDAAHQLHPLAGQGVNLGLQDVSALAGILITASSQGVDLTDPLLYRRYARQRQAQNLGGVAAMEGFRRLFAPTSPAVHAARNLGMRVFNQSGVMRRLAGRWASGHR